MVVKVTHFASVDDALAYMASELVASLEDDLCRMSDAERDEYSNEDRKDLRAKIADMKRITPLVLRAGAVETLPPLVTAAERLLDNWGRSLTPFAQALAKSLGQVKARLA